MEGDQIQILSQRNELAEAIDNIFGTFENMGRAQGGGKKTRAESRGRLEPQQEAGWLV